MEIENRFVDINSPKYDNNYAQICVFSSISALAMGTNACHGHAGRTLSGRLAKPLNKSPIA